MMRFTRRRMLTIAAAAVAMPRLAMAEVSPVRWEGAALGARASMILHHPDRALADEAVRQSVAEVERLERIFSLYRQDSAVRRLNRDGYLTGPPPDLVRLLSESRALSDMTDGAFDVTVQPLWALYARYFEDPGADPAGPAPESIDAARVLIDFRSILVDAKEIRLMRPGMAVTLNGIAQGYITDRIADLLRGFGFENALVHMGETLALGPKVGGAPWQVALAGPVDAGRMLRRLDVVSGAVATSSPRGTMFDPLGRHHHLFDAKTGRSARGFASVTVQDASATRADALSTAIAATPETDAEGLIAAARPAHVHTVDVAGQLRSWPAS